MSVEIFCCYARKDQQLLQNLMAHLMPLQRQGHITVWSDTDINAGKEWEMEITEHLNTSQIILLLVSPDFMMSEYIYSKEMKRAIERHEKGEATVIPIILRWVSWQRTPLGELQALPRDGKPVKSWQDEDEAFYNVAEGIRKVVMQLTAPPAFAASVVPDERQKEVAKPNAITPAMQQTVVASSFLHRRLRRLPVFFLLDTSKEMEGTYEVTMQQGLQIVKTELIQHALAAQRVHIGAVTFDEKATFHNLVPLDLFTPPSWEARGQCALMPAFARLIESLTFDLIISRSDHPGDYTPLVFLILGGQPTDTWQGESKALTAFTDNRRPMIVTLVTRAELVKEVKAVSQSVLLLDPPMGECITNFFYWVAQAIVKVCEDSEDGTTRIEFPDLPYGVIPKQ